MPHLPKKITSFIAVFVIGFGLFSVQSVYAADNCCLATLSDNSTDNLPVPDSGKCTKDLWTPAAKSVLFNPGCTILPAAAPAGSTTATATTGTSFTSSSPTGRVTLPNPLSTDDPAGLIQLIVNAVLGISGSVALIIFIIGGITWMTSEGDQTKVKKGLDTLIWAAIGMTVIFGSYALATFVVERLTKA